MRLSEESVSERMASVVLGTPALVRLRASFAALSVLLMLVVSLWLESVCSYIQKLDKCCYDTARERHLNKALAAW